MTDRNKNAYLIAHALHKFIWASILASVTSQIAMTTDAVVVSRFIGPDAIAAVNLTMPVMIFFNFLTMLFGVGGSVLVAKSLGERDAKTTSQVFLSTIVGVSGVAIFFSILFLLFCPQIAHFITSGSPAIYPLSLAYLRIMLCGTLFMMLFQTVTNFVKTDGNPRLVMHAVLLSALANLLFDLLFIVVLKTGIEGSAWASIIGNVLALLLCSRHFRTPNNSFFPAASAPAAASTPAAAAVPAASAAGSAASSPAASAAGPRPSLRFILRGVQTGFPMGINTLLLGISTYAVNSIILRYLGTDGVFAWAVCFQLFVIQQMVLGGIGTAIYSIGGLLVGERDVVGLRILARLVLKYVCLVLLAVTLLVLFAPQAVGWLFLPSSHPVPPEGFYSALRIYSLLLVPYAAAVIYRFLYQILGYWTLSVAMSVVQMAAMVLLVWLFACLRPEWLWWGFPASALLIILTHVVTTVIVRRRHPDVEMMTLIPWASNYRSLNFSVRYRNEDVQHALDTIVGFLESCDISSATVFQINLCCEELMYNIVTYAVNKDSDKHMFDIHIVDRDDAVSVLIKDDGKPFNPILTSVSFSADGGGLGLALVNTLADIKYRYMYDQNVVFLTFARNAEASQP